MKAMKKIISAALIAAMLTASLSGCKDETSSTPSSSGTTSSSADNTSSEPTSSDTASSDATSSDTASTPSASGSGLVDRMDAIFAKYTQYFTPGEGMSMILGVPDPDTVRARYPMPDWDKNPDAQMTHCVFSVEAGADCLAMLELTDLNLDDCEDYVFSFPMMSASLKRFVIVKPKADKKDAVKAVLTAYADVQKQPNPMEYPGWEVERAGTVIGETSDGCIYVVVAEEGAEMGSVIAK